MQKGVKDKENRTMATVPEPCQHQQLQQQQRQQQPQQQQQQQQQPQQQPPSKQNEGFLGSFLSKGLKTNQLVVNTDEKTLRPVARLKEPRDLFALPKDKDNDCSQQAPRWPVECQVIEERIKHIPYVPATPEPLNAPTGNELKPRPVGEENGIVVFSYSPISAVNYEKPKAKKGDESSDESDYSSDSHQDSTPPSRATPMRLAGGGVGGACERMKLNSSVSKMINSVDNRSTSASLDDNDDCYDDDEYDTSGGGGEAREKAIIKDLIEAKKKRYQEEAATPNGGGVTARNSRAASRSDASKEPSGDIDDIWKNNTSEYKPASPHYILSQFGKKVSKAMIDRLVEHDTDQANGTGPATAPSGSQKFSRSAVGGARFVTNCHPMNPDEYDGLEFESRFESGNLAKAVQITPTYYELYLRPDLYTSRSKQWFYFRVRRTRRKMLYRFSIVNLVKSDSLYNDGMQPVMYSTLGAKEKSEGWRRCGENICYYRNDDESASNSANEDDEDNSTYTLTFTIEFEHDDDTVFFAHSYPYTYSDLQDYLMEIQRHPVKSKFCKLRLLCRTLAGNNVYYLTVTAPSTTEENMRRKKSIVVSARVHPSETPASWMMKGLMDFITGDTTVAKRLRHKFIFKLVPMLNPDGVIVGNTRNSLTGKDLNRQYRTVIRETYPSIWYTKAMIRRLIEECGVAMYCDMHAHSRKHNIFIYGCENKRNPEKKLTEQVFPLMLHKNSADRFSFESCKFKIQRSKEGTGRIVVWMLGITNSYTIEASFGGSSLGSRKGTHFSTQDYEHMGRAFCETLLDYCDENPNKVKRHAKLFKQIKKIRKREKREQKALKLQKLADQILNLLKQQDRLRSKIIERLMREGSSADEPLNIPLSDYSSDEGNCSSSSDNEGKHSITASDLEGPCCAPTRAPPSSPEVIHEIRKFRMRRMRKVMHELDKIYFTPLFQRKFKTLIKLKRRRHKLGGKSPTPPVPVAKRPRGGQATDVPTKPPATATATAAAAAAGVIAAAAAGQFKQRKPAIGKKPIKRLKGGYVRTSESSDSVTSSQSESCRDQETSSNAAGQAKRKVSGASAPKKTVSKKKKKFMPTEKKKPEVTVKPQVNRNFRLWLANRCIYIYRRKKSQQTRRTKLRSKQPKKRGEVVRTTLDLPTTDPGSDLHFSTDDEEHSPTAGQNGYGAVAPLRHTLLQSDLQRRYIEEIGDTVVQKPKAAHMPPELIVTTPSKSGTPGAGGVKKMEIFKLTPRTAPELDTGRAAGGGGGGGGGQQVGMNQRQSGGMATGGTTARRTYSWHNLDQQQDIPTGNGGGQSGKGNGGSFYIGEPKPSVKAMPKQAHRRSVPHNFIPQRNGGNAPTADDLQLKLSLKKKVWTGAHGGDADGRPLAWYKGHSVAGPQMSSNTTATGIRSAGGGGGANGNGQNRTMFPSNGREAMAAAASNATINMGMPPVFMGAPRKPKKLEQVDLFNACSQKLIMWQQQQQEDPKRSQPAQQQLPQRLMKVEDATRDRDRERERDREQQQREIIRAFRPIQVGKKTAAGMGQGKSQQQQHGLVSEVSGGGKVKRKSSSMMKIAETTQLVTRFARNRSSAGGSAVQQQQQQQHQQMQQHHHHHQRMMLKNQGGAGTMPGRMHSAGVLVGRGPNKFKTGGLVITAVQQPAKMPGGNGSSNSRRMRNAAAGTLQAKSSSTGVVNQLSGAMHFQRNSNSNGGGGGSSSGTLAPNKSQTGISLDTVNLVRKVKTKLKKRKSRTLSTGAAPK
ncbi:uncharacterized protein LOC110176059 isoform X6 [Drosophila serrata]|uniref:uncharacterized protein LOC110176059 isoform X6 n=1 Tax=Drosophila serrata TaxID=7274 RepID=UPI000A1D23F4|nr:uncharacterized protein LOC110176059 isoform X6 [Drosophila serrata]